MPLAAPVTTAVRPAATAGWSVMSDLLAANHVTFWNHVGLETTWG
jgi:hypothetical protein